MRVSLSSPFGVVEYSQDCIQKKNAPAVRCLMAMFRGVFFYLYMCRTSYAGITFVVSLLGSAFFSPWVVSVIIRMFDLSNLGLDCSKGTSGRKQIHPILRI